MPTTKEVLVARGVARVHLWCKTNQVPTPPVTVVPKIRWRLGAIACAYYRPEEGIRLCLEECAYPAGDAQRRNWNWPGSTTDRTPYGVVCHELGHHIDYLTGATKAKYSRAKYASDFSTRMRQEANESPLTSYCPNDEEWFAEMFRLFVTNPRLLSMIKPRTFEALLKRFKLVTDSATWKTELGAGVPDRILKALANKFVSAIATPIASG